MPIQLIADVDDDEQGYVLYDPAAVEGEKPGFGGWEDKRETLSLDGRAAVHVGDGGLQSHDNPGTERRVAWVCVDEDLPAELADRARLVVEGARLQVPSGKLYWAGAFAVRPDGPPEWDGETYAQAEIPPGDYHLDIYLADWRDGEPERFVEQHSTPMDRTIEHHLGCLGLLSSVVTLIAPIVLLVGYVILPLVSHTTLHPDGWKWTLFALGGLWLSLFLFGRSPGQKRLIAARRARDAKGLPSVIYVLTHDEPGDRPAFYHEEAPDSRAIRRRYDL